MKKLVIAVAIVTAVGLIFVDNLWAGRVGDRQIRQQKRIHQGIKNGELTGREVCRLEREQNQIIRFVDKS